MHYLYILFNSSAGKFYVGQTANIKTRIDEHNKTQHNSKFTRKQAGVWELVYLEEYANKTDAIKRERFIKRQKSRQYILNLFASVR